MSAPREATIRYEIKDNTAGETDAQDFHLCDYELNEAPETTAYDISQAITQDLDRHAWDAVATIKIFGPNASSPRLTFEYINGGRGWEARSTLETWIMQSLSLICEHECEHGPISNEANRASTRRNTAKHGAAR